MQSEQAWWLALPQLGQPGRGLHVALAGQTLQVSPRSGKIRAVLESTPAVVARSNSPEALSHVISEVLENVGHVGTLLQVAEGPGLAGLSWSAPLGGAERDPSREHQGRQYGRDSPSNLPPHGSRAVSEISNDKPGTMKTIKIQKIEVRFFRK